MACSADTCAAARTGVCVILVMGRANVDWAGRDKTVTQVHQQSRMKCLCFQKCQEESRLNWFI